MGDSANSAPGTPPVSSRPFALAGVPENEFLALSTAVAIGLASGLNGRDTSLLADFLDAITTSVDVLASVRLYREGSVPPIISPPGVLEAAQSEARLPFRQRQTAPKRNP